MDFHFRVWRVAEEMFQSLFWWRGHLDPGKVPVAQAVHGGFNPCFGGEAIWTCKRARIAEQARGFNPCFGGEAIWTGIEGRPSTDAKMFQSLFWWRGHLDICPEQGPGHTARVSILVLVERPFGLSVGAPGARCGRFQSLFWWRGHLDFCSAAWPPSRMKFQSLFWWRGHLDLSVLPHFPHLLRFNPCFGGEAIWTSNFTYITFFA